MTQLRKDPVVGRWVLVSNKEEWGPDHYEHEDNTPRHASTSPFVFHREYMTPPEVAVFREPKSKPNMPGWWVRVVPNKFPALKIEGLLDERQDGVYDLANGIGAHEVLIETPDPEKQMADFSLEEVREVLTMYQHRLEDLAKDQRFHYIMIFKNFGESAGASIEHAHSQLIALPMVPRYIVEELKGTKGYYQKNKRCVFCDMIGQEYRDQQRIICENDEFIAITPYAPRYPFESWILPKYHHHDYSTITDQGRYALASVLKETLERLKVCLNNPSFNYYLHTAPVNQKGHETYHWHLEIVPKLSQVSGLEWGTEMYVVRTSPQLAARYLREASIGE